MPRGGRRRRRSGAAGRVRRPGARRAARRARALLLHRRRRPAAAGPAGLDPTGRGGVRHSPTRSGRSARCRAVSDFVPAFTSGYRGAEDVPRPVSCPYRSRCHSDVSSDVTPSPGTRRADRRDRCGEPVIQPRPRTIPEATVARLAVYLRVLHDPGRRRSEHRRLRRAGRGGRGQPRRAAQGPLPPRPLRRPRRRLRGPHPARPHRPRPGRRAVPRLRAGRHRQPRLGAGRLRRLRHAGLRVRRPLRRRPRPHRAADRRPDRAAPSTSWRTSSRRPAPPSASSRHRPRWPSRCATGSPRPG